MVGLQTDDSLILANALFAEREEVEFATANPPLKSKLREALTVEQPMDFNGSRITLQQDGSIVLTQKDKTEDRLKLAIIEDHKALRALGAYISRVCQPEAACDLSFAVQITHPDDGHVD
ncbi:hypothetical protein HYALB_00003603 [Hymenoscyphus albidus]|uniref:Uncharacterized protein n=1 Tax=Hymenoscyphus albidus TaxID=595503 RepID=A0A9N9Q180_9HELO|nr:hypothetical protein HYALB_00003603 [Hymenoscyphus albidus]